MILKEASEETKKPQMLLVILRTIWGLEENFSNALGQDSDVGSAMLQDMQKKVWLNELLKRES